MSKRKPIDPVDQVIAQMSDPFILGVYIRGFENTHCGGEHHKYDMDAVVAEVKSWLEERRDVIAALPCDRRKAEPISVSRAQDALGWFDSSWALLRKHRLTRE